MNIFVICNASCIFVEADRLSIACQYIPIEKSRFVIILKFAYASLYFLINQFRMYCKFRIQTVSNPNYRDQQISLFISTRGLCFAIFFCPLFKFFQDTYNFFLGEISMRLIKVFKLEIFYVKV